MKKGTKLSHKRNVTFLGDLVLIDGLLLHGFVKQIAKEADVSATTIRETIHGKRENLKALEGLLDYMKGIKNTHCLPFTRITQQVDEYIDTLRNRIVSQKKKLHKKSLKKSKGRNG